ncbi:MAG TPA: GNAT family N-acetyltransferase [Vicinamibacteria bacterium]|nr:GNAT family N-acetyltransferase [Vicinamibacteria bacterium]
MDLVPLNEVSSRALRPLLREESEHWGHELYWDFGEVASAVENGLDRQALFGRVARDGARTVAYCYYMIDGGRAIIGSLFAASGHRDCGLEETLLDAVLADAQARPGHERVECQTLFSTAPAADHRFTRAGFKSRLRHYLVRRLVPLALPDANGYRLRTVRRDDLPAVADLVHRSHRGSLDAALNLTYATPALCRGFVDTLVLRSGCGKFSAEASILAEGPEGLVGVILASELSRSNGHICQVSVDPSRQSRGLGSLLLASSLEAMRRGGLETASLSVTVDNGRAYAIYMRLGFALRKEFGAHAWVRPPARIELPA